VNSILFVEKLQFGENDHFAENNQYCRYHCQCIT